MLAWLLSDEHRARIQTIAGRTRRCGSQEGNALAACTRLGFAEDERVVKLAASLVAWQWPDGGWNCDRNPDAWRSSFHESLPPLWGLHEHATRDRRRRRGRRPPPAPPSSSSTTSSSARSSGEVINTTWLALRYPPFWHYNVLQALLVLSRMGLARRPALLPTPST